jgi:predicted nucleic acid-binding protein
MHYLDTNIIVYSVVNQDPRKMEVSQAIIRDLFEKDKLLISPLNLQELVYTLSKLKIDIKRIEKTYFLFQQFCMQFWGHHT